MAGDPNKPDDVDPDATIENQPQDDTDNAAELPTEALTQSLSGDLATEVPEFDPHNAPTIDAGGSLTPNDSATSATLEIGGTAGSQSATQGSSPRSSQVPSNVPSFGDQFASSAPTISDGLIGHFRIVEELGSGGFGTVVRAFDTQLDRDVAIKIIKSASLANDPRMIRKFKDEARAAASLRHPNIIPVHQSGDYGLDQTFIVFDYIRGRTLRRVFRKSKLTLRESIQLLAKISDALGYAHSRGIVHRDVKPENILIDEENKEPHIADFGCARRRQYEDESTQGQKPSTTKKKKGYYIGTPSYFSPEQASGNSHLADARSDVWSLGVIMDEMLSGRRTFRDSETSRPQLMNDILNVHPQSLLERCEKKKRPIDADINAIWQCCLAKNPDDRYPTAAELNEDLESWLRGDPVSVRPLGYGERFTRWAKRNPAIAGSLMAVAAAITIGFLVSSFFWAREVRAKQAQVRTQIDRLLDARPDGVGEIFLALKDDRLQEIAFQTLRDRWDRDIGEPNQHRLALAMNLFEDRLANDEQSEIGQRLFDSALSASADELQLINEQLESAGLVEQFRNLVMDSSKLPRHRLRALCNLLSQPSPLPPEEPILTESELASLSPECMVWLRAEVANKGRYDLSKWVDMLRRLREHITIPLETAIGNDKGPARRIAANILFEFYKDQPQWLLPRVFRSDDELMPELLLALQRGMVYGDELKPDQLGTKLREAASQLKESSLSNSEIEARNLLTLLYLRDIDGFLESGSGMPANPSTVALIEKDVSEFGIPLQKLMRLVERLIDENVEDALFHSLLGLGSYEPPATGADTFTARIAELFSTHPKGSIHAATGWLMNRWQIERSSDSASSPNVYSDGREWRVSEGGETFIRFAVPAAFTMGSPKAEQAKYASAESANIDTTGLDISETRHQRALAIDFEMAAHELTVAAFRKFIEDRVQNFESRIASLEKLEQLNDEQQEQLNILEDAISNMMTRSIEPLTGEPTTPVTGISWFDAIEYCVWRSNQEGLDSCYGTLDEVTRARQKSRPLATNLAANGYRLPTVGEWEYVTRANSESPWYFGSNPELINLYAVNQSNSNDVAMPVGRLKPNRFGIFDLHGNAAEWTTSTPTPYPTPDKEGALALLKSSLLIQPEEGEVSREIRGGGFSDTAAEMRSARRYFERADAAVAACGFRLTRSLKK